MKTTCRELLGRVLQVNRPIRLRNFASRPHFRTGAIVRFALALVIGASCVIGFVWSLEPQGTVSPDEAKAAADHPVRAAVAAAHEALQAPPAPADAFIVKALAQENLAWLLGDRESYKQAVEGFTNAIEAANPRPEYLLGRGRCYYKQAIGLKEWTLLDKAADDLKKAINKPLQKGDQVEALYWLGLVYGKKNPAEEEVVKSYMTQAAKLAELDGSFTGSYAYGLEAIAQWGEFNLEKASKPNGGQSLQPAIDQFERQRQFADKCKNEKHLFWACNRIRYIGERFYEVPNQPLKAYRLYQKGLPTKIADATDAHVRLLNSRNALLAKPNARFQQELRDVKPPAAELIRDAEHCLKLVSRQPRHQWISDQDEMEANLAAAFCYHNGRDKDNALKYLRAALGFPQDPTIKPLLDKFLEDWSKE
jgi:tetratricopeptide (TPR) repeat protein